MVKNLTAGMAKNAVPLVLAVDGALIRAGPAVADLAPSVSSAPAGV
jgi:hypothetical protein